VTFVAISGKERDKTPVYERREAGLFHDILGWIAWLVNTCRTHEIRGEVGGRDKFHRNLMLYDWGRRLKVGIKIGEILPGEGGRRKSRRGRTLESK